MVENLNKLEAAFLAGRLDAYAERHKAVPEGVEELLRMVLSESDCASLARLSRVLFQGTTDRVALVPAGSLMMVGARERQNGGSIGGKNGASSPEVA